MELLAARGERDQDAAFGSTFIIRLLMHQARFGVPPKTHTRQLYHLSWISRIYGAPIILWLWIALNGMCGGLISSPSTCSLSRGGEHQGYIVENTLAHLCTYHEPFLSLYCLWKNVAYFKKGEGERERGVTKLKSVIFSLRSRSISADWVEIFSGISLSRLEHST